MKPLPIVLLPGLNGTGDGFHPLCRVLPSSLTPHITSYPPDRVLTYSEAVDYAAALLPPHPVVLLGESYSGPVALMLANKFPERISALILCCTFVTPPFVLLLRMLYASLPVSYILRHPPRLLLRYFLTGMDASQEYIDWVLSTLKSQSGRVLASRVHNVINVDVRRELSECKVPMLYIRGSSDRLVTGSKAEEILALRPDITVARIPGPHQILQRQPDLASREIEKFLSSRFV